MKTIYNESYKKIIDWLITKRLLTGITQEKLADVLNKPQSYVSKYENRERRLDLLEFLDICKAIEADPKEIIKLLNK
jgi:transcriptional regulator with XRE-family HTH domain